MTSPGLARSVLERVSDAALSGNAKDICVAEAKGKDNVAKADAEAAYQNTPKARASARVALVQANYNVTMEKCDALAGMAKDGCVASAKVQFGRS